MVYIAQFNIMENIVPLQNSEITTQLTIMKKNTETKKHLVVFTGAGISAESGISTFRDSNGLWENHDVSEVASIEGWHANKALMLKFYNQRREQLQNVLPNNAHYILAELEKNFNVSIITQNVDNLHERAGSTNIIHLHGELTKACNENKTEIIDIGYNNITLNQKATDGSQIRPFIVWFGEQVPLMEKAADVVETADILLVIGTSLQVYPAAGLVDLAPKNIPVFLIDPNPQKGYRETIVIKEAASKGMELMKTYLLEGKALPTNQAEENDEMILAYNQAIIAEPNNFEHWIKKSQRLGELGRYDEAMICQDKVIELMNNSSNQSNS